MLQGSLVQWCITPMSHWSDAPLVLQIGAQVMYGSLVLRPDGRSIVRRFIGPTSALNFLWIWKRTHCNHRFNFLWYSKYYRYYLYGEMFFSFCLFVFLFVCFCFYNETYTLKEKYFTISTDSHICCVDIQFEGINSIMLIITIMHITLNFCAQNTYTWTYRTTTYRNKNISSFPKSHMRN